VPPRPFNILNRNDPTHVEYLTSSLLRERVIVNDTIAGRTCELLRYKNAAKQIYILSLKFLLR